jgi:general secretion pathway protein I
MSKLKVQITKFIKKEEWLKSHMFERYRANTRIDKGFTLLEVLVAVAILGVGLTIIIELFSGGLRLGRTSEEYTRAVNYARLKMEEMAVKPTIKEGSEEGEFDETFRWQVEVKKVNLLPVENKPDFKPPAQFFQVQISVIWKSGSKERSTRIESYRTIKPEDDEKKT